MFSQVASAASNGVRNSYNDFYNAGYYLVSGFANGISANSYLAEARARAMAAAAANAARRELNEHSPSKVGYEIGDYFGVAFVNAIGSYEKSSYEAGSEIAKSAKSGLSEAVSKISDFIDSDLDTEPTIRPVLDLTNVADGTGTIGRMLGAGYSLNLASRNNAYTSTENGRGLGVMSDNSDVVEAIASLRNDVSSLASVIGNLKVVMDTGALVGTLTGPLDASLGKQAIYTGRGI